MKIKSPVFLLLFIAVILCGTFSNAIAAPESDSFAAVNLEAKKGGYKLIDVETLWSQYQKNKENILLVDTRQEWEYHAGYIQGALNFPMEPTWLTRMTRRGALEQFLGPDKTKTLVFY